MILTFFFELMEQKIVPSMNIEQVDPNSHRYLCKYIATC